MDKNCENCDIISSLAESGLTPVLEHFLICYISPETALKMCQVQKRVISVDKNLFPIQTQVSPAWRSALNIDYVWKIYCVKHGLHSLFENWVGTSETSEDDCIEETLEPLCIWGSYFRLRIQTR